MTASNPPDRHELVVVTGASTGMGAATARELARRGFHVLAGVRRDIDADALRGDGIEPHILDVTVDSHVAAIADRVAHDPLGRPLRALINNAGISVNAPVEALPIAEWRRQFEVNLFGHIAMTQALLPALLRSSGTVVNISSVGEKVGPLPTFRGVTEAVPSAASDSTSLKTSHTSRGGASISMLSSVNMYQMVHRGLVRGIPAHNSSGQMLERRVILAGVKVHAG